MRAWLVLACVLVVPAPALAEHWVVAEAPAALAVSDAQQGIFRPGIMPAFGAYADRDWLALGVRLRAGVLRDGPAPGAGRADPGLGGLTTATLAMRVGARGAWLELAGGGGITGSDVVPSFEVGAGWMFATERMAIGPAVRYVHVEGDAMSTLGSARLALVGIDLQFGRRAVAPVRTARPAEVAVAPPPPVPEVEVEVASVRDADAILDHDTSCIVDDGCRLTPELVVIDDRIVLDERVLFDLDRARVRSSGRRIVAELVAIWQQRPEWTSIVVEGHADVRGSDEYNLRLSQRRADQVRALMIRLGADGTRIEAVGRGRGTPRALGHDEASHRRNRRVEFAITRAQTREASR